MEIEPQVAHRLTMSGWQHVPGRGWVLKGADGEPVYPTVAANQMALASAVAKIEDQLFGY